MTCNKRLDSTSACDADGVNYCKACYGKAHGPKGFGFAAGGTPASEETRALAVESIILPVQYRRRCRRRKTKINR